MPHPEEETEKQERYDVHGFSHCVRFKVGSQPRHFRADTPERYVRPRWLVHQGDSDGTLGRTLIDASGRAVTNNGQLSALGDPADRSMKPTANGLNRSPAFPSQAGPEDCMQLTPREFDKLLVYMMADVALKRRAQGLKLNYPEAVAVISAVALDGARAGKTIEDVTKEARTALTKADVMDGVADLVPMVQIEAVFTDGSRLVTVHTPIQ
jgi:urease subunit gamma